MAGPTALVTLSDVHNHLNISLTDLSNDAELQGFMDAAQQVVENIVGPVVQQTLTETYDGGTPIIVLRHEPIVSITSVTEYRANTAYTLTAVTDPTLGTTYSYEVDLSTRRIVRRAPGSGTTSFPTGQDAVKVVYVVGLATVPANIRLGALELIRHWYQQTQQGGRPAFGADVSETYMPNEGFAIPNRVRELLLPQRRAPAVA